VNNQDHDRMFPGKAFISTILDALDTKTRMTGELRRRYLQRAGMAGFICGVFYAAFYAIEAAFESIPAGDTTLLPIGRLIGALVFGWALVFIYYTKSELLTSNMMITAIGAYHRRISWVNSLRLMAYCYLGNFLGGIAIAILFRFSSLLGGPVAEAMQASVDVKVGLVTDGITGWADLFVRAILCNFMINLAMLLVYNGLIKDDFTKSIVMVMAVFVFAYLGLEHSVANTVLFTIVSFAGGAQVGLMAANVAIVMVGNFVGGGLLIGLYYAYVNDDRTYVRKHPDQTA
jgi:formate/nitrite transporter FocA (FNT family)